MQSSYGTSASPLFDPTIVFDPYLQTPNCGLHMVCTMLIPSWCMHVCSAFDLFHVTCCLQEVGGVIKTSIRWIYLTLSVAAAAEIEKVVSNSC